MLSIFCDARLNAGSVLEATGIFLYLYYRKHIKLFLEPMNWEKMFVSIELYSNVSIKSHSHKLVNMSIFRAGLFCYGTVQSYSNEISTGKIRESWPADVNMEHLWWTICWSNKSRILMSNIRNISAQKTPLLLKRQYFEELCVNKEMVILTKKYSFYQSFR